MIELEIVGNYLGRDIGLVPLSSLCKNGSDRGDLQHASLFLWIQRVDDLWTLRSCIPRLVGGQPLALFVAGLLADEALDDLLDVLADARLAVQIMTKSKQGSAPECIEDFLRATWPSEDRFRGWSTYILTARIREIPLIREAAKALL